METVDAGDRFPGACGKHKGAFRFLQYRCVLYRGQDTLATPVVKRCSLRWNAKPAVMPLDSLHVNGKRCKALPLEQPTPVFAQRRHNGVLYHARRGQFRHTVLGGAGLRAAARFAGHDVRRAHRSDSVQCGPITHSDTTITLVFSCRDKAGWNAAPQSFAIHARNSLPQLRVAAATDTNRDGKTDTFAVASTKSCNITEADSIDIAYTPKDTNDPGYRASCGSMALAKIRPRRQEPRISCSAAPGQTDGDTIAISLSDPDTTVMRYVYVRTNHAPHILSVTSGAKTLHAGDTLAVAIGVTLSLAVNSSDSDVAYWTGLRSGSPMPQRTHRRRRQSTHLLRYAPTRLCASR